MSPAADGEPSGDLSGVAVGGPGLDEALDPHLRLMLQAAAARGGPDMTELPLDQARGLYRDLKLDPPAEDAPLEAVRDLQVAGADGPLGARLYVPREAPQPGPGLVFFHGGGFVIGDLETHDGLCRRLASRSGVRVLAVDYRLAPEHPFPAAHDDALAAARWAFAHAAEIGFDSARIAVGGDSAGGNLAASVALDLRGDEATPLAFQLLLYPVTQWRTQTGSMQRFGEGYFLTRKGMDFFQAALFGGVDRVGDTRLEVLHEPALAGVAPALVVTAGFDPLKDEGLAYAEALKAAGVKAEHRDHPAMLHGFYNMAGLSPAALQALDETAEALASALKG